MAALAVVRDLRERWAPAGIRSRGDRACPAAPPCGSDVPVLHGGS